MNQTVRPPARRFEDLIVWQKAHEFVLAVYKMTSRFPKAERYGLTNQFRRAAVSVPANIVEGWRRQGKGDKIRFLNISQSSLEESKYYLRLANDLDYISSDSTSELAEEISKLLTAYLRSMK